MNNSKSSQKLKIGDVVRLKSGGPKMTVAKPEDKYGQVKCVWFTGDFSKQHFDNFSPGVLKIEKKQ